MGSQRRQALVLLFLTVSSATVSANTGKTQVSGRSIAGQTGTSTAKPGSPQAGVAETGKPFLTPPGAFGKSIMSLLEVPKNVSEDHYFSEIELERLCPPGNTEILKSIPKEMHCSTGNLDFWYQRCRCHYVKIIPCPPCPEDSSTTSPSKGPGGPSGSIGHGLPHFILGSPHNNSTIVYQIPIGENNAENGTAGDFATANKFNVYNSAGGIVNLYFYQTGQQQIITPPIEKDAPEAGTTNATTTSSTPLISKLSEALRKGK